MTCEVFGTGVDMYKLETTKDGVVMDPEEFEDEVEAWDAYEDAVTDIKAEMENENIAEAEVTLTRDGETLELWDSSCMTEYTATATTTFTVKAESLEEAVELAWPKLKLLLTADEARLFELDVEG